MPSTNSTKILMVCLGNICRSPTAHSVLSTLIKKERFESIFSVDSAGTGSWHLGEKPDKRSVLAAKKRGYDMSNLVARQVTITDFSDFDYIFAMDRENLGALKLVCPERYQNKLELLMKFGSSSNLDIPDPFYGESSDFEFVLDLIEDACEKFLELAITNHDLR